MDQIKIYLNYIKEIINGEEYLSDRDKFTLILHLCAFSHLIFAGIFLGFGNILMMLYNLLSITRKDLKRVVRYHHRVCVSNVTSSYIFIFVSRFLIITEFCQPCNRKNKKIFTLPQSGMNASSPALLHVFPELLRHSKQNQR